MGCSCTKEALLIENKKFYVVSRIAEGGFGTIDLVEEAKSDRVYALKKIKCEGKNEIEKASLENKYYKLLNNNPNIVKLIYDDIVQDKKSIGYFVMSVFPYYQNGNLQEELDKNTKQSNFIKTDRLIKIFQGICHGLNYIHESNLAHRDLKPQNVLMGDDRYHVVLTDFGSMTEKIIHIKDSKKCQEVEDWAAQNCSMFYKAPELFSPKSGSVITEKADIWSLGCLLYALMYNKGPFDYVVERGDSIALAAANAKYTIPNSIKRENILVNILKNTICFDESKRECISKILNDLENVQLVDETKEAQVC